MGRLVRAGVGVAAGALVLGLSAGPAASQAEEADVELTGQAFCNLDVGQESWTLVYSFTNQAIVLTGMTPADLPSIEIQSATLSGAVTGTVDDFDPNPVVFDDVAVGGYGPVANSVQGTVTLTVVYAPNWWGGDTGTATVDLVLDGSCALPATTSTSTTTTEAPAVQAAAVAVVPTFTG